MTGIVYVSQAGLQKMKDDLDDLLHVQRPAVVERIKEARSHGDLSENAEYESAINQQSFVEGKIAELMDKIKHAKVMDNNHIADLIFMGSVATTVSEGLEETYTIVGATEADPFNSKISIESPMGRALVNHKVGDTVEVETPAGKFEYKIKKVE